MNNNIYSEVKSNTNFAKIEEKIIKYWQKNNIFQQSIDSRPENLNGNNNEFIFYDGPPFANGLPHYGHLLTGFIKDLYARYQTIKGKKVERRFGWDCHGLPAEMQAEKELKISGYIDITKYGIDKFNDHCRRSVLKYTKEWEEYVTRQARWVDFVNDYKTMDINFMESIIWAFKELYKKGYIYKAQKVVPYSLACQTPLSNFETRLDNSYRERVDKAITITFEVKDKPKFLVNHNYDKCYLVAWTTTPWTLPSNLALAVNPKMQYVALSHNNNCYIVGAFYKDSFFDAAKEIIKFRGKELKGIKYQPLFDYFANHKNAFKILSGNFILEGEGTGIVHIAPGFGEEDHELCKSYNIEIVCPIDTKGHFTKKVYDFEGIGVFEANEKIIKKLKEHGNLIKIEQYPHNYPHCWRTDTPLIYRAISSWYVKVTAFKDQMVKLNQKINWIPSHVKNGLFGKWLKNAKDWAISRHRFWGTPIPVWESDDPKYPRIDVYGSIVEIERDFNCKITDLHRPFIDEITRPNPDDPTGKSKMRRVSDVFDCWFESGSMPYAQVHYPFENKDWFNEHFPADFIVEYSAQTRGWFYTLMVLSTSLFNKVPFLNCICHGVILDATGQKLSKRLNNYPDPFDIFNKYGADALRFTMLNASIVKGSQLLLDKEGKLIFDTVRLHLKPLWQSYHFFTLYANADGIKAKMIDFFNQLFKQELLDQYILAKLRIAVESIEKNLDNFDSQKACQAYIDFFEVLNNWYIRRSRERFWRSKKDENKIAAYNTLYTCLIIMVKACSPMLPLISEEIYLNLTLKEHGSVHLSDFPDVSSIPLDQNLVDDMDFVKDICTNVLFIRNQNNIKIRQPLSNIKVIAKNYNGQFNNLLKDELNIKNVTYSNDIDKYAQYKLTLNLALLGKRLPHKIQEIIKDSKKNNWLNENGVIIIAGEKLEKGEYQVILEPIDVKNSKALSNNKGIVILDTSITYNLKLEGVARDLIRFVQQARKDANLNITDKIALNISSDDLEITEAVNLYNNFINEQTLTISNALSSPIYATQVKLNKKIVKIAIEKC